MRETVGFIALAIAAVALAGGYRVRAKKGAVMILAKEMDRVLVLIELAHQDAAIGVRTDEDGQEFTGAYFTSGRDVAPYRVRESKHQLGQAVDLRTKDLSPYQIANLIKALRRRLPREYQVVDETNKLARPHIHVEYDPQ